jgi:hypothetical protein
VRGAARSRGTRHGSAGAWARAAAAHVRTRHRRWRRARCGTLLTGGKKEACEWCGVNAQNAEGHNNTHSALCTRRREERRAAGAASRRLKQLPIHANEATCWLSASVHHLSRVTDGETFAMRGTCGAAYAATRAPRVVTTVECHHSAAAQQAHARNAGGGGGGARALVPIENARPSAFGRRAARWRCPRRVARRAPRACARICSPACRRRASTAPGWRRGARSAAAAPPPPPRSPRRTPLRRTRRTCRSMATPSLA